VLAYWNGRFVPPGEVALPLDDAGFVWGATITDRARTFNGRFFQLAEHVERFRQSCSLAHLPLLESSQELTDLSERLLRESGPAGDVSVIWLATPGPVRSAESTRPTLIAIADPIDPSRAARLLNQGATLASVRVGTAVDPRIKHRSRLAWWTAAARVREADAEALPLFIDPERDYVRETPTSNVLAVISGEVISPPKGVVLDGISLDVAAKLCEGVGLTFSRREVERDELEHASEILVTNTTDCLVGVSRLDGKAVPFPGPVLNRLLAAWSDLVGVNLRRDAGAS
jgi:branched-subunit amino acid aminotransferase/4-amino-4-deoxychorismate lyase